MKSYFIYLTSILGSGIKLGHVAIIDEIGLIFTILYNRKTLNFNINYKDVYVLLLLWMIIIGLVGGVYSGFNHENINVTRYIILPFFLLLFYLNFKEPNFQYIYLIILIFILLNLAIPIYGLILDYPVAFWQDWLWSGTAYVALAVFYSSVILTLRSDNIFISMLIFITVYLIGILLDSRAVLLLSFILIFPFFFKKPPSLYKGIKQYLILCLTILLVLWSFKSDFLGGGHRLGSVANTINELVINQNENRDVDRKQQVQSISQLANNNKLHFIFGHGALSHQYDLVGYLPTSSDGRVRPVGITAIIWDGGLILFLLIIFSGMFAVYKMIKQSLTIKTPLYVLLLCLSFPSIAIFIMLITNTMEMVIWWLALSPKGLGYVTLLQFQKSHAT